MDILEVQQAIYAARLCHPAEQFSLGACYPDFCDGNGDDPAQMRLISDDLFAGDLIGTANNVEVGPYLSGMLAFRDCISWHDLSL
jgi:hypothetical protein